jgi:hypothetical protein
VDASTFADQLRPDDRLPRGDYAFVRLAFDVSTPTLSHALMRQTNPTFQVDRS